jgi:hypothetical protein
VRLLRSYVVDRGECGLSGCRAAAAAETITLNGYK